MSENNKNNEEKINQYDKLVVDIRTANPFLAQRFRLAPAEHADKRLPPGLGAHLVKVFAESGGDIVQPHDQLCDIGVHQIGVLMHIVQRRILDINRDIRAGLDPRAHILDPQLQIGGFRAEDVIGAMADRAQHLRGAGGILAAPQQVAALFDDRAGQRVAQTTLLRERR